MSDAAESAVLWDEECFGISNALGQQCFGMGEERGCGTGNGALSAGTAHTSHRAGSEERAAKLHGG